MSASDRAHLLLELAGALVVELDAEGRAVYVNALMADTLGYEPDAVVGVEWIPTFVPERLHEEVVGLFARTMSGESEPLPFYECPLVTRAGVERHVSWRSHLLAGDDGRFNGVVSCGVDVTERVLAEQALRSTLSEVERANRELEAFNYTVSHDLRAPLRSIEGFAELLREEVTHLSAEHEIWLDRIRVNAERMSGLLDDLLELSRLGQHRLELGPVDLAELARRSTARLNGPARVAEWIIPGSLPTWGDPRLLGRMLDQLLDNAFKFSRGQPTPRIEVGRERDRWFVRDNGVGFDMAHAHKLFRPFQRLHSPHQFEGQGMGLAAAHRIVARHGGRMWAESVPDGGATFWFTLPDIP